MASRLKLQTLLEKIMDNRNVYFQPPSNLNMSYPAIRYELNSTDNTHSNNQVYSQNTSYKITLIDRDPDSDRAKEISKLPKCAFNRFYTADNLNHWVYTLYY